MNIVLLCARPLKLKQIELIKQITDFERINFLLYFKTKLDLIGLSLMEI